MIILVFLPGGGFTLPRTPKIRWGWFLWVPNFAHKSPPNETGKKIDLYVKSQRQTVKLWP